MIYKLFVRIKSSVEIAMI